MYFNSQNVIHVSQEMENKFEQIVAKVHAAAKIVKDYQSECMLSDCGSGFSTRAHTTN